jgi:hypothetical protein
MLFIISLPFFYYRFNVELHSCEICLSGTNDFEPFMSNNDISLKALAVSIGLATFTHTGIIIVYCLLG